MNDNQLSPEKLAAGRKKGQIIYRPVVKDVDGKRVFHTSDGVGYLVDDKGTNHRYKKRVRISKKERLKNRRTVARMKSLAGKVPMATPEAL